jgi:N-acetylmuramoyl-L-alanine amidase
MVDDILRRIERLFSILGFIALVGIVLMLANMMGLLPASGGTPISEAQELPKGRIALISGHAGSDSGAVCEDAAGQLTLTEADVVAAVTQDTAQLLTDAGYQTLVLEEFDPRLDGLTADVLLSLHADSCVQITGYKAAYQDGSPMPMAGDRILECIDANYATVTSLRKHSDTVTHDMTQYHAFRKIDPRTPAVILELGFLGGDYDLLVGQPQLVAQGVAQSLLCFLQE